MRAVAWFTIGIGFGWVLCGLLLAVSS